MGRNVRSEVSSPVISSCSHSAFAANQNSSLRPSGQAAAPTACGRVRGSSVHSYSCDGFLLNTGAMFLAPTSILFECTPPWFAGAAPTAAVRADARSVHQFRYAPSARPKNTIADATPVKRHAVSKPLPSGRSKLNPNASVAAQTTPLIITGQLIGTSESPQHYPPSAPMRFLVFPRCFDRVPASPVSCSPQHAVGVGSLRFLGSFAESELGPNSYRASKRS